MKLKKLGNSQTEITTAKGDIVLYSYNTPVAAQLADGGFIVTNKHYSATTTRHINSWLNRATAKRVDQSEIDDLV